MISSFVDKLKTVASVSTTLKFISGSDLRVPRRLSPADEEEGRKITNKFCAVFFQENKD